MKYDRSKTAYERMISRVKIPENKNECWLWCGPVNNAGYGMVRGTDGYPRMMTVHRVAAQEKGLDIKRKEVNHTCLTRNCVNPDHLVIGNVTQRIQRMKKKYNGYWMEPKVKYRTCKICNKSSHIVWFSRHHKHCKI